jgi:hypothetical protein
MSISRNILLCTVCQSLFNVRRINDDRKYSFIFLLKDARQLRCGHSFCYQCIVSQFDRLTNKIICSRCK